MSEASALLGFLAAGEPIAGHRPWPRYRVSHARWLELMLELERRPWALLGLWAEPAEVHAALFDEESKAIAVASLDSPERRFPSLSSVRPGAIRLERAAQDLFGMAADGLADRRPWLDHGQWTLSRPMAPDAAPAEPRPGTAYAFLAAEGEALHQIPVGPVHAGIIEPGHFRFHCNGEAVVRLEQRLGYVHKGSEALMRGRDIAEAAKLAARLSGDSTVAHSLAFARAVEAALGMDAPARAHWLRALMGELERVANHLGDIGAICNDASFVFMHSQCSILRERVLRACAACFGHRLMMDRVVPGGVACDLGPEGARLLGEMLAALRRDFPPLVALYDDKPSLNDRTATTGVVSAALAHRFAAGGYVGRASARSFDARRVAPYPPYGELDFEVPVLSEGDVNARVWVRIREVQASLGLIEKLVEGLPSGQIAEPLPRRAGEGMALVEGFRGDILTWVRLDAEGRVLRCHPRDPSWFQWPLLEAAIEGNIVADFPICNKSFNCSYSGHDL
jgi:Ni,Fe-hydrogenase III large subunit